jgi:hypothetical protein
MFPQVLKCCHVHVEIIPLHGDVNEVQCSLLVSHHVSKCGNEFILNVRQIVLSVATMVPLLIAAWRVCALCQTQLLTFGPFM